MNFRLLISLFLLTSLIACNELDIVHDLVERDANQILVLLERQGIRAEKEKVEKNQVVTWSVKVKSKDAQLARDILVKNNLPKVRQMGLEGICKDAGLILTPKTEKCREILAYKGEIINSLESIPGVVSADVVLNLPDKEDFPDSNQPVPRPTASVTVQALKTSSELTLTDGKVQEFVANAVNDLDPRDVAVIISVLDADSKKIETHDNLGAADSAPMAVAADEDISMSSILGLKMDDASVKKFRILVGVFLSLFLLLIFAFIFVLLRMSRLRKQAEEAEAQIQEAQAVADEEQRLLES